MNAKAPARLFNDLLSRKGMAAPSAGPETRVNMVGSLGAQTPGPTPGPAPGPTAPPTPGRLTPAPMRGKLADRIAPEHKAQKRIRVSLRLDEDRHTRLKLVATQRGCTLQSIFTQSIDEYFDRHAPDLKDVTARLRSSRPSKPSGAARKGRSRGKRNTEGRHGSS